MFELTFYWLVFPRNLESNRRAKYISISMFFFVVGTLNFNKKINTSVASFFLEHGTNADTHIHARTSTPMNGDMTPTPMSASEHLCQLPSQGLEPGWASSTIRKLDIWATLNLQCGISFIGIMCYDLKGRMYLVIHSSEETNRIIDNSNI